MTYIKFTKDSPLFAENMDELCKTIGTVMLMHVGELLDSLRLPYFLTCGTALGAYRDRGFSAADLDARDIDIGFLAEDFVPRAGRVINELSALGFSVYPLVKPFTRCWGVKAKRENGWHVDLFSYAKLGGSRFNSSTVGDFCDVHPAGIIETTEKVMVFGKAFRVPSPIEMYLEGEYGPGWRTPTADASRRSRVDGFEYPKGLLDPYGPPLSCAPLFLGSLYAFDPGMVSFYAGYLVGQAEKVVIGACKAFVVKPAGVTLPLADDLGFLVEKVAELYGLRVCRIATPRGDDTWLYSDTARDLMRELILTPYDSQAWHTIRGQLCGVPSDSIDPTFGKRYA